MLDELRLDVLAFLPQLLLLALISQFSSADSMIGAVARMTHVDPERPSGLTMTFDIDGEVKDPAW